MAASFSENFKVKIEPKEECESSNNTFKEDVVSPVNDRFEVKCKPQENVNLVSHDLNFTNTMKSDINIQAEHYDMINQMSFHFLDVNAHVRGNILYTT